MTLGPQGTVLPVSGQSLGGVGTAPHHQLRSHNQGILSQLIYFYQGIEFDRQ